MSEPECLIEYCQTVARQARAAANDLLLVPTERKNAWLRHGAQMLRSNQPALLEANARDVQAAPKFGLNEAQVDRLRLTPSRIEDIASGLEKIADLPDPNGQVLEVSRRPNDLEIRRVRVPLGVVFFIYESRPNVTADAAAICVKSGNAVILRGGKEAAHSSRAIVSVLQQVASEERVPKHAVQLVETSDRDAVGHFLRMSEWIDLAIPRGGVGLIRRVANEATMPVIKHFSGNCHVYVDATADLEMARQIVVNAKCQRMGVCNAAESLLVHQDVAEKFLPLVEVGLAEFQIELRADERARTFLQRSTALETADLSQEYLGPILSVCVVDDVEQSIEHINRYGSGHTDAIVSEDPASIERFTTQVDSAAVIVNASTRFHDGSEFGLGAEIGISTDKFHARGPCGLNELMTYKYIVYGRGQVRT